MLIAPHRMNPSEEQHPYIYGGTQAAGAVLPELATAGVVGPGAVYCLGQSAAALRSGLALVPYRAPAKPKPLPIFRAKQLIGGGIGGVGGASCRDRWSAPRYNAACEYPSRTPSRR